MNSELQIASKAATLDRFEADSLLQWVTDLLIAQEHAKLEQGGHTQNQIPLRQVFIDLPVGNRLNPTENDPRSRFLENFLQCEPARLDEASLNQNFNELSDGRRVHRRKSEYGFALTILIGGPGQGKSTLTQLASQVHRAAILKSHLDDLGIMQRALVRTFTNRQGENEQIPVPTLALLPIQVSFVRLRAELTHSV